MKTISSIAIAIFFFVNAAIAQKYVVNAALSGFPNKTKFYLKDLSIDQNVDSALLVDGQFSMSGKISHVKSFWLYTSSKTSFQYTNLTIGADKISVKGDVKDFPRDLTITGSPSQDVANVLNLKTKKLWKDRDSIVAILMPLAMGELQNDSIKTITKPLSLRLKQIDTVIDRITEKFIRENINSYVGLEQLYYQRSRYKIEDFKKLFSKVKEPYLRGTFASRISAYIRVGNPVKEGENFFDFEASNLKGKKYKVSDYKGKYILLDFTETYCGPCIIAAENLKKIAVKYPDQLQVITFYAETNKKIMQEGLDRDKFTWPTIWDGKGTYSEIVLKYGVVAYPTFVLIKPDGKIASIVTGFGLDEFGKGNIENLVDQVFSKAK